MDNRQVFLLTQEYLFSKYFRYLHYAAKQGLQQAGFFCFASLFLLLAWLPSGKNGAGKTRVKQQKPAGESHCFPSWGKGSQTSKSKNELTGELAFSFLF